MCKGPESIQSETPLEMCREWLECRVQGYEGRGHRGKGQRPESGFLCPANAFGYIISYRHQAATKAD